MPEIDGIEFLRHLSDIGFRGGVVLLSGAGAATLKTAFAVGKAYGLNMVAYAEKPVPPDCAHAPAAGLPRRCRDRVQ